MQLIILLYPEIIGLYGVSDLSHPNVCHIYY